MVLLVCLAFELKDSSIATFSFLLCMLQSLTSTDLLIVFLVLLILVEMSCPAS